MTEQELVAYFQTAVLPDILRLNRASTQHNVAESVIRNMELMQNGPKDGNAKNRLMQIKFALENPYDGPAIPKL